MITLRHDKSGKSPILPIALILVVVLLFAWQTGMLAQFIGPTPETPPDQTFDIVLSEFSDPVASSIQGGNSQDITVSGSNVVLSNGGGDYTATFKLNVRDTKIDQVGGVPFTMKVVVGSYSSPTGMKWPVLVTDATGNCPDIEYLVSAGGSGVELGCDTFQGSITTDGGSVAITVTIQVNGDLFGTGLPSVGVRIPLTFSISGASDASVVWVPTG